MKDENSTSKLTSKLAKEKLDEALGIDPNGSIDDLFSGLDLNDEKGITYKDAFNRIGSEVQDSIKEIDSNIQTIKSNEIANVQSEIFDLNENLKNVSELISISKGIILHLYNTIVSSELIDAELVASAASFITAAQSSISEYLTLYRERMRFYDTIRIKMLEHENKEKELRLKAELFNKKSQPEEAQIENMTAYSQEKIIKTLQEIDLN